uniref:uncharacterized protein At2g27730, mitochondrial n=1 Tax=Erigeron canadensis TaxID=72917 RepID=UPI001CB989BC|nr:uncharacterized protein At2g27730, mitochondrial [Erigeron canadensis]
MAMRSGMISRSLRSIEARSSSSFRLFSDQGRILSEEERAAENIYIKKMEKEKLEKQKLKEAKEKAEKDKAPENKKP